MFPTLFLSFLLSLSAAPSNSCEDSSFVLDAGNLTFSNKTRIAGVQNCLWNFTFPPDYMAKVSIETSLSSAPLLSHYTVVVSSQWGQQFVLPTSGVSLYVMWPPTNFVVTISTTLQTTTMVMNIDVNLQQFSIADKYPTNLTTAVNRQPYFIQFDYWAEDSVIKVNAEDKGRVAIAAGSPHSSVALQETACIFIYDVDLKFYGTLYSVLTSTDMPYYIHYTDALSLYRAKNSTLLRSSGVRATLIINDYKNMQQLENFLVDWSQSYFLLNTTTLYQHAIVLNATTAPIAMTVLNDGSFYIDDALQDIYLQKIEYLTNDCLNCTSPVKVLAGGMIRDYDTQGTLLMTYNVSDSSSYPQHLPGTARTFIMEKGAAIIYYTSNVTYTRDSEATEGRSGFIMSNNYPFMDVDQNSDDFVLKNVDGNPFVFEYTVKQHDSHVDAYLDFSVQDLKEMKNFTLKLHNYTSSEIFTITALEITMTIVGGSQSSTGTFISYTIPSNLTLSRPTSTQSTTKDTTTTSQRTTSTTPKGSPSTTRPTSTSSTETPTTSRVGATSAPTTKTTEVILICVGIIVVLVAVVVTILCLRYHIRRGKLRQFWVTVSGILPIITKIDEWELGEEQLKVFEEKELGQGAFAVVYEGELTGNRPVDRFITSKLRKEEKKSQVAVKRLPPKSELQARLDFLAEVNFMKKLGYHPHILGMVGCITTTDLPLMVLDYCDNGDLLSWVRKNKYSMLESTQLLSFAWQISDGLCYLKSLNLIHRDLAARNVLLTKELVARISDFGLSREPEAADDADTYLPQFYVSRGGRLPIKWMAPESLRSFHFSFKSDVWSFGVLLWEMFTLGDVPFAGVLASAMLEILENGERLPQVGISDPIYKLMASCWEEEPKNRESIEKLKDILHEMLKASNEYGYLMISPADETNDMEEGLQDVSQEYNERF